MTTQKLIRILSVIFILILCFLIFFSFRLNIQLDPLLDNTSIKDTLRFEIIKSLLNLMTVALVGGLIAYLFKLREATQKEEYVQKDEQRKQEQIRIEIRIDYFKRLGIIYRNIKNARRALRGGGLTTAYPGNLADTKSLLISGDLLELYKKQMKVVNKYQLELEGLKIESKSLPAFVHFNNIETYLGRMEDYLRKILNEFEDKSPLLNNKQPVHFTELERLDEFTGRTTKNRDFKFSGGKPPDVYYRFTESFGDLYKKVIEEIGKNLG